MNETKQPTILIVDDDKANVDSLSRILKREGYTCLEAHDGRQGLDVMRQHEVDLVITDMMMPNMDGVDLLKAIKTLSPRTEVIMVTAYGSIERAVEVIKQGAYDFVIKPIKRRDIVKTAEKALERVQLVEENQQLRQRLKDFEEPPMIIGPSAAMRHTMEIVRQAAPTTATVMIQGASGTGKELIAREIHRLSPHKNGRFVPLNCTAFPETLIDSELFGFEKGAFTNADKPKPGRFELANGGTLFLDEIGELPPSVQVKLLRVLQERTIERLGSTESTPIDIRLVTATHRNLQEEVKAGRFREDLFYRLNVIELHVPPLRERPEDIPLLVRHFLEKYSREYNKPILNVSPETMEILQNYEWRGNVRQLENVICQAVVLSPGPDLLPQNLPGQLRQSKTQGNYFIIPFGTPLEEIERHVINETLNRTGDKKLTAQLLGIATRTIYRKLESFQEDKNNPSDDPEPQTNDPS